MYSALEMRRAVSTSLSTNYNTIADELLDVRELCCREVVDRERVSDMVRHIEGGRKMRLWSLLPTTLSPFRAIFPTMLRHWMKP